MVFFVYWIPAKKTFFLLAYYIMPYKSRKSKGRRRTKTRKAAGAIVPNRPFHKEPGGFDWEDDEDFDMNHPEDMKSESENEKGLQGQVQKEQAADFAPKDQSLLGPGVNASASAAAAAMTSSSSSPTEGKPSFELSAKESPKNANSPATNASFFSPSLSSTSQNVSYFSASPNVLQPTASTNMSFVARMYASLNNAKEKLKNWFLERPNNNPASSVTQGGTVTRRRRAAKRKPAHKSRQRSHRCRK